VPYAFAKAARTRRASHTGKNRARGKRWPLRQRFKYRIFSTSTGWFVPGQARRLVDLIALIDGYDIAAIAFAAPRLIANGTCAESARPRAQRQQYRRPVRFADFGWIGDTYDANRR